MPRAARAVVAGCAHHVTQRGNNHQDVFLTNHVHLAVMPEEESSPSAALKRTNQLYAQYVNRLHRRSGHLWQDRFYCCPLDQGHFWRALAYIERDPIRAHLCSRAWEWRWSSAGAHCGPGDPWGLLDLTAWTCEMECSAWRKILQRSDDKTVVTRLRLATSRGRPLGSDAFIAKLETLVRERRHHVCLQERKRRHL
jgi:putative transposase